MTVTIEGVLLGLLLGALLGGGGAALLAVRLAAARAELAAERRGAEAASRHTVGRDAALRESFAALSADALAAQGESVARLAEARLREVTAGLAAGTRADAAARTHALSAALDPVAATLTRVEGALHGAEREREAAFAGLREQVEAVAVGARGVAGEARALTTALRAPHVRGRWGEMQLERVVDLAGMVEHCDFSRQPQSGSAADRGDADGVVRPDLVVHLAGGKNVVVDAKVPFAAYLESTEATDDAVRRERARAHARQVRAHVDTLSGKEYWRRVGPTPEFVVMFVPGEVFLSAALEADPALLEHAFAADVVVATPTTLIALLRTVGHAWRQETLAREAAEIHRLGRELHTRLGTLSGHLGRLGRSLEGGVKAYNETVSSLESRVLVSARRFADLAVTRDELPAPDQVERRPRTPAAPDAPRSTGAGPDGPTGDGPAADAPSTDGPRPLTEAELDAAAELARGRTAPARDVAG